MAASLLAARLLLAAVFAIAGVAKLSDLAGSRETARDFGVPSTLVPTVAVTLPIVELLAAAALVPVASARWGGLVALILLAVFMAAIAAAMTRDVAPDCHCFGQLHSRPVGAATMARNVALAGLAGFIVVAGWRDSGLDVAAALDHVGAGAAIGAGAGLALAAALALALWLLAGMLRQQGRILERLQALESAGGHGAGPAGAGTAGARSRGLPIGERAPDLSLVDTTGRERKVSPLPDDGLPTLLVFTDPACGPCNALLPDIAHWQRRYAETARVVLVTSGTLDAARAKSAEHQITGVLVDRERAAFGAFGIQGTPSAVLLDATGRVASATAGGAAAVRVLAERAGNGSPTAAAAGWTLTVGDRLPALTLTDRSGERVDLAEAVGKSHLIVLWDPRCPYCQRLAPELRARAGRDRLAPELTIVVNRDAVGAELADLPGPILLDPVAQVMGMLGARGTPSAVAVDASGRIASPPLVGGPAILAALEELERDSGERPDAAVEQPWIREPVAG